MNEDTVVLTATGLTKRYGRITAVDGLDLAIGRGEVLGFLGPNGAGKTTTMRMLVGLVRPDAGTAVVCGERAGSPASMQRVGALVESPAFYPFLSGRDNLRVLSRQCGLPSGRADDVLDIAGLTDRARDRFAAYSLGMKQRLGVAAALLKEPRLLILDEPTNGLDPVGIADMRALISGLGDAGTAVLLSSHQLGEVEQICDRITVISRGRLVYDGTLDDLRGGAALVIKAAPLHEAERHLVAVFGRQRVTARDHEIRVAAGASDAPRASRELLRSGIDLIELRREERSLEEVFLAMTGDGGGGVDEHTQ